VLGAYRRPNVAEDVQCKMNNHPRSYELPMLWRESPRRLHGHSWLRAVWTPTHAQLRINMARSSSFKLPCFSTRGITGWLGDEVDWGGVGCGIPCLVHTVPMLRRMCHPSGRRFARRCSAGAVAGRLVPGRHAESMQEPLAGPSGTIEYCGSMCESGCPGVAMSADPKRHGISQPSAQGRPLGPIG
jgi:hypothetical protein